MLFCRWVKNADCPSVLRIKFSTIHLVAISLLVLDYYFRFFFFLMRAGHYLDIIALLHISDLTNFNIFLYVLISLPDRLSANTAGLRSFSRT